MKVPLLEYLDKLEAHANSGVLPLVNGKRIALDREATLALIAKLREAVELAKAAVDIAARPVLSTLTRTVDSTDLNAFQDRVIAWAQIEVPE